MKRLWLILAFLPSVLFAASAVISPPANFGLGDNQGDDASSIAENESPDSVNVVNTTGGTMEKRGGSRRFIDQAFSTQPFNSLYRAYGSTSSVEVKKAVIATTGEKILVSTSGANPLWVAVSSFHPKNSHWSFQTFQNKVIMAEETLQSQMLNYNIMTGSVTPHFLNFAASTETLNIKAKHILVARDQLLMANVVLNSTPSGLPLSGDTYFSSRLYYSYLFQPSSFTYNRAIFFDENDGEEITGLSEKDGLYVWKPSKIFGVDYGDFGSFTPIPLGGTYSVIKIVDGFGLFAPRSLVDTGDYYVFADKGGVRIWDGARKTRLQVEQESKVISDKIQPIIDRCIEAGTWKDAVAHWYPKKRWYMLSVEDPALSPKGKKNLILTLDFDTLSWFRFRNWDAESFASWDGAGDLGELVYGSSSDGYVYFADDPISANDARRELPVHDMDNASAWARAKQEVNIIKEGTASIKLTGNTELRYTSATFMGAIRIGEWQDRTKVEKSDLLSFKVYATSAQNVTELRIDLAVDGSNTSDFTQNFTSVSMTGGVLANNGWATVDIALSSFTILSEWTDLATEDFTFADTLTFFGIRIFSTGTAGYNLYIDDMRIVDDTERSLAAYRWTKMFNFGVASGKEFKQILLNADIDQDTDLFVDIYKDFGSFVDRQTVPKKFGKEIHLGTYGGAPKISKIDSVNFSDIITTEAANISAFSIESIATDEEFIFAGDQYNNRIVKISKSSFTEFVDTIGSVGSGKDNFNFIGQIGLDDSFVYVTDIKNHRVKVHKKGTLDFVRSFGQLGQHTTSFHLPMGIAVDGDGGVIYVVNDGNYNILKLRKSDGSFIASASLDYDTFGEASLAVDEKHLYVAYRAVDPGSVFHTQLIMEKRDKTSMSLLDKETIYPESIVIAHSTYSFEGDISLSGQYIYMTFTDDFTGGGRWYLQKRLKSDFSVVKELILTERVGTVSVNERSYRPSRKTIELPLSSSGAYLQLKFSEGEDSLDNHLKLFNQAYKLVPQEIR